MNLTGEKVGELLVKPWTWGKVEQLAPSLSRLYSKCKSNNVTITDIQSVLSRPEFLIEIMPEITEIISITVNETQEVVKEKGLDEILIVVLKIFEQNIGYLKNLSSPIQTILEKLVIV